MAPESVVDDQTTALQSAVDGAARRRATIVLGETDGSRGPESPLLRIPAGEYHVAGLVIPADVTLCGSGRA